MSRQNNIPSPSTDGVKSFLIKAFVIAPCRLHLVTCRWLHMKISVPQYYLVGTLIAGLPFHSNQEQDNAEHIEKNGGKS